MRALPRLQCDVELTAKIVRRDDGGHSQRCAAGAVKSRLACSSMSAFDPERLKPPSQSTCRKGFLMLIAWTNVSHFGAAAACSRRMREAQCARTFTQDHQL